MAGSTPHKAIQTPTNKIHKYTTTAKQSQLSRPIDSPSFLFFPTESTFIALLPFLLDRTIHMTPSKKDENIFLKKRQQIKLVFFFKKKKQKKKKKKIKEGRGRPKYQPMKHTITTGISTWIHTTNIDILLMSRGRVRHYALFIIHSPRRSFFDRENERQTGQLQPELIS